MQWKDFASHIRHLSQRDQKKIREAFDLGKLKHGDQKRKSGEPYFNHPIIVAQMLIDMGADADTIIAALLHDTIEDTDLKIEEIEAAFDGDVRTLVEGVTKLSAEDVADQPNLNEQIETLRKMFTLMEKDVRIMVIKLVDRLHNMQTAEFLPQEKRRNLAQETLDVYVKIADRLCMQDIRDELEGLCLLVLEPETHGILTGLQRKNKEKMEREIKTFAKIIASHHPPSQGIELHYEPATWDRLRNQSESGNTVTGQTPFSVAFICKNIDQCYVALGLLHQRWQREMLSFQDFINSPAINGYKGLHTTIILEDGTRIRCKIRTEEMHAYARNGITLSCFGKSGKSLPWTQRIAQVAEDTEGRSDEFWATLQSDILGESIVVHGPDDQTVLLPSGSTVLDGLFYVFGEMAIRAESARVDGKAASFRDPLPEVATLDASFADHPQVELSWVDQAHTGFATALVRQGLANQSHERKIHAGERILQEYLTRKGRGFLSEFNVSSLNKTLKERGYESLKKVYIQMAEGRIEPKEVDEALFEKTAAERKGTTAKKNYILRCTVASMNRRLLLEILQYYQVHSIRIRPQNGSLAYICSLSLSPDELRTMQLTLKDSMGVQSWAIQKSFSKPILSGSVFLLFLLWGFDPVFARLLLYTYHVSVPDLTIVRFWSLSILSGLLFLVTWLRSPIREARLSVRNRSLWFSVLLLMLVAFTSYEALRGTLPNHYTIPMTTAGVVLTSMVNKKRMGLLVITWTLLAAGLVALIVGTPDWSARSIFFTIAAVAAFTCFSIVSERYKRQERVDLRAAQYFFVLSILCTIGTLPLFAFSDLLHEPWELMLGMIAFSVFFAGLPYYIYYYLLSHQEIDFVLRFSFLIILTTGIGEFAVFGLPSFLTVIGALLVTLGAILPLLRLPRFRSFS